MDIALPDELRGELEELVRQGEFPDVPAAVVALVRVGLGYRYRREPQPRSPPEIPDLPPRQPGPAPPGDVNWIG